MFPLVRAPAPSWPFAVLALTLGCSSSSAPSQSSSPTHDASTPDSSAAQDAGPEASTLDAAGIVAARPYAAHVPSGYDAKTPAPLLVMFHGYGVIGALEEGYMDLTAASDAHSFLYAYGNGTVDKT